MCQWFVVSEDKNEQQKSQPPRRIKCTGALAQPYEIFHEIKYLHVHGHRHDNLNLEKMKLLCVRVLQSR
jgi:hypothetical protein